METLLETIVNGIMDAIEEFFDALIIPTQRYTLDAFIVSLTFLLWSVIAWLFDFFTFVNWQEALTCSILLGIIVLIDTSTRSQITSGLGKVKTLAEKFSYSGEEEEFIQEVDFDESGNQ